MAGYYHANYWHANYWHANYWGEPVIATTDGDYWHETYWHADYWHGNYWANGGASTQIISQPNAAQMTLLPFVVDVERLLNIEPATAPMTLTAFQADAANDITVSVSLATRTLTGIDTTQDSGEFYEGDISFSVYASSGFDFTDGVPVGLATMALTGISPGVSGGTGDVLVGVTSTPVMTLSAFPTATANPVVIAPVTPGLTLTKFNVVTGFGTLVSSSAGTRTLSSLQTNVTGVNADINEFSATLATLTLTGSSPVVTALGRAIQPSGGFIIRGVFDSVAERKRRKLKELEENIKEIEKLPEVDREIAQLLHKDDKTELIESSLKELESLVKSDITAAQVEVEFNPKVAKAFKRAAMQGNFSSMQALEREMDRLREEEDFLLLAVMTLQ